MIARIFTGLLFLTFALAILTQFPFSGLLVAVLALVAGIAVLLSE